MKTSSQKKALAAGFALLGLTAFAGKPSFHLPGRICAAPGLECNIYYKNIINSVVPQNYSYQVQSKVGTAKLIRWHWTPEAKDGAQMADEMAAWVLVHWNSL